MRIFTLLSYLLGIVLLLSAGHAYQSSYTLKKYYTTSAIIWAQSDKDRIRWYFQWDQHCFQTHYFYDWFLRVQDAPTCLRESGAPQTLQQNFLLTLNKSVEQADIWTQWYQFPWRTMEEIVIATSFPLQTIGATTLQVNQFFVDKSSALMQTFHEKSATPVQLAP